MSAAIPSHMGLGQDTNSPEDMPPGDLEEGTNWADTWDARGMPWRTEPPIPPERQQFLAERRQVAADIEHSIYPFGGISLTRSDIEWLLASGSEVGAEPARAAGVKWTRPEGMPGGLDLRGADLRGVSLARLPLAGSLFGLAVPEAQPSAVLATAELADTVAQEERRTARLEAELRATEAAARQGGRVNPEARRRWQRLRRLVRDQRTRRMAKVDAVVMEESFVHLADYGYSATIQQVEAAAAHLEGADLREAILDGAIFTGTHLEGANLRRVSAHAARLGAARLVESDLAGADLRDANLRRAVFSERSFLAGADMRGALLADVQWAGANLAVVDWVRVGRVGDERESHVAASGGIEKPATQRLGEYEAAARANRQLAIALRAQGLNEAAHYFAYHALLCQQEVLYRSGRYLRWLGFVLLWLVAGYGYRPLRSVLTYILVVLAFACAYFLIAPTTGVHLAPLAALVFSVTSFHGRGLSPGEGVSLTNPLIVLAAAEAVCGLLIEITFIATFTQRVFAR